MTRGESLLERLTIVVVTYRSMAVFPGFLEALQRVPGGRSCRVLVCDNASNDGIADFVAEGRWPNVELLGSELNEGFGAGLNRGIQAAKTEYVALMNPDVAVPEGTFEKLLDFLIQNPDAAGVSSQILSAGSLDEVPPDGAWKSPETVRVHRKFESIWSRAVFYSGLQTKCPNVPAFVPWSPVPAEGGVEVSRFHGCFGIFRRADLLDVGMFDPRFFLFFEEDDLGYRFRKAGKRLYVHCGAAVFHLSGKGSDVSGSRLTDRIMLNSQYMFFRKHFGLLYAWAGFAAIWSVISMVFLYQMLSSGDYRQQYKVLWCWHWQCLGRGGGVPEGTILERERLGRNYNWTDL